MPVCKISPLILTTVFSVSCMFQGAINHQNTREVERLVNVDSRYARLDEICSSLIPPEGAKVIARSPLVNSAKGMTYLLQSDVNDRNLENFFIELMQRDNWTRVENDLLSYVLSYRKDETFVDITIGHVGRDINLAISCYIER